MYMIRSMSIGSQSQNASPTGSLARCSLVGIALFIAVFCFGKIDSANADTTNNYRQWAFIQLNNLDEFYCLDELYFKESRWNPLAKNNGHYGIPQGKSIYLLKANGYRQIEWGIKYNLNRYGSMCKALKHFKDKGWH